MALFYLKVAQENLLWFNKEVNIFHVAVGGDSALFGKDDTACSLLVNFLNRGKHILSSSGIFFLFLAQIVQKVHLLFSGMINFFLERCHKLRRRHSNLMDQKSSLLFLNSQMTLKCFIFSWGVASQCNLLFNFW